MKFGHLHYKRCQDGNSVIIYTITNKQKPLGDKKFRLILNPKEMDTGLTWGKRFIEPLDA